MKEIFILAVFVAIVVFFIGAFTEAIDTSPEFEKQHAFTQDMRPIYND